MEEYIQLLTAEIGAQLQLSEQPLQTIFFGGGTPSLVPPQALQRILAVLEQRFGIASDAEISMEADPGTFNVQRLQGYAALGVNRFSMGVQSFQQEMLAACGRSHTLTEVHAAIDDMHAAGIQNWSLDLISGLPNLTEDVWQHSLEQAVAAQPAHISVYDLQVEQGTLFAKWYQPGAQPLPSDDTSAQMYRAASRSLQAAGFEHYELSNYAKPGMRHNMMYWQHGPFYAFGLGAASFLEGRRFSRPKKMKPYANWRVEMQARVLHRQATGTAIREGCLALTWLSKLQQRIWKTM
eukprot:jgi/Astpho2/1723/Aster-x1027